jgi:hypothetical protein
VFRGCIPGELEEASRWLQFAARTLLTPFPRRSKMARMKSEHRGRRQAF